MGKAVVHRLIDGRWRVTGAPADWVDDGRDYPEPKPTDRVYEHQADAIRDYLARVAPRDPEDEIPGPNDTDSDAWEDD